MIDTAKHQFPHTTHRTLKFLALLIWVGGPLAMGRKASELLLEAHTLRPASLWIWGALIAGIMLGLLKARFMFRHACKRNLARIDNLKTPKFWQFYRPFFFAALGLMVVAGVMLSRMSHGNFGFIISVAILDLSIATALLVSSSVFWEEKAFAKS